MNQALDSQTELNGSQVPGGSVLARHHQVPRPTSGNLRWSLRTTDLSLDRPLVMGILNLTPDSFSDGGGYSDLDAALDRAHKLVEEGADLLDVGGESTRPGAAGVSPQVELERVCRFLTEAIPALHVPVSIDTRNASVARVAIEAGVEIVNDVSGLHHDPAMAGLVADSGVGVVLMHMRGQPDNMSELAVYQDLIGEVRSELAASVQKASMAGVMRKKIAIDPGLGFAKKPAQSLRLLRRLPDFLDMGFPIVIGPSRKGFVGKVLDRPPHWRVNGTTAACVMAYLGGAAIFRVHDVRAVSESLAMAEAIVHADADQVITEE